MIKHEIGDMFASDVNVFVHQVNCKGIMGSGVAKQVRDLFPDSYSEYKRICRDESYKDVLLGGVTAVPEFYAGRKVYVANLFAQNEYGRDKRCYTDYDAFRKSLMLLRDNTLPIIERDIGSKPKIAMPYRIGCDRGGGDWNTVYRIIEEELGDYDVTLYELPKNK